MRGALSLAPAEYQDGLLQYVEALDGKPIEEIQAALTGSLVTSEVGRAFLENQARVATLGVQQGQLDVSRQDLVLRRQKQALDARGEGEWEWKEGVDANGNLTFAWVNPRTREVVMADLSGGAAPAPGAVPGPTPIPAPDAAMPGAIPAPGTPGTAQPVGAVQPPTFRPKPKADAAASESERLAAYNSGRVLQAAEDIVSAIQTDPSALSPGNVEAAIGNVADPNIVRSAERQQVVSAQRELVDALLTLATGAAYNREQREGQIDGFIPKWSDKPAQVKSKLNRTLKTLEIAKVKSGRAWTPDMDAAFQQLIRTFGESAAETAPPAATPTALPEGATTTNW
jgi:hypothetical protein